MKKEFKCPWVNLVFILLVLAVLTAGLIRAVFFPKEINEYENRYANRVVTPTLSAIGDRSFQDGLEDALSDQIFGAEDAKRYYNEFNAVFQRLALLPNLENRAEQYVPYQSLYIYGGDRFVYPVMELEGLKAQFEAKAVSYNALFAAHPDLEFFSYYIEKDTDIHFDTGIKTGASDYMMSLLNLPEEQKGIYCIDDFEQFCDYFYRTDHHWNHKGSYEAYRQLLELLQVEDAPLEPQETLLLSESFSGSKNAAVGTDLFLEDFEVYRFTYPTMRICLNGNGVADYGKQEGFQGGYFVSPTYGTYYGGDGGEILFDTDREDRPNLLIIGESYDNAILKLLASHFNTTCSVDLRYYRHYFDKEFDFSAYVKEHDIDQVLLIGNVDYYNMAEFTVED